MELNNQPQRECNPSGLWAYLRSFSTLVVGPFFIAVSIVGLWYVEHQIDYAKLAQQAPRFSAHANNPDIEQLPLVALTGTITCDHKLGDRHGLIPGNYLQYTRTTQVYAWSENHKPKHTHDAQGRNIKQPPLTYTPTWTETPAATEDFLEREGHENPNFECYSEISVTSSFKVGNYHVLPDALQIPPGHSLKLSPSVVTVKPPTIVTEHALYTPTHPHTNLGSPLIGDLKTTYSVVEGDGKIATIFGQVQGKAIGASIIQDGSETANEVTFQRLFWGTPEEAILEIMQESRPHLLPWRIAMLIVMLLGLLAFLSPTHTFLGAIPVTSRPPLGVIILAASVIFYISLVLSSIMPTPYHVLGVAISSIAGLVFWLRKTTHPS